MTPQDDVTQTAGAPPAAVFACPTVMRKRADFVRASHGRRQATAGFHLQALKRGNNEPVRVGFTCSKKVGNAVARNRAKRRLREIARLVLPRHGRAGWDYVLVGKRDVTATRDFAAMQADLVRALESIHK